MQVSCPTPARIAVIAAPQSGAFREPWRLLASETLCRTGTHWSEKCSVLRRTRLSKMVGKNARYFEHGMSLLRLFWFFRNPIHPARDSPLFPSIRPHLPPLAHLLGNLDSSAPIQKPERLAIITAVNPTPINWETQSLAAKTIGSSFIRPRAVASQSLHCHSNINGTMAHSAC